jgi:predicted  nucleic acid-binding Zn-ribbon protein
MNKTPIFGIVARHRIDTAAQLEAHKGGLIAELSELGKTSRRLRNQARSIKDEMKLTEVKAEIATLSERAKELRREVKLCEDIERRSADMSDKIHKAAEHEKPQGKEIRRHDPER